MKAFFAKAKLRDVKRQLVVEPSSVYNPFARTVSTMHIAFTYDPDVDLGTRAGNRDSAIEDELNAMFGRAVG